MADTEPLPHRPFDGVVVLDFTHGVAGSYATMFLCDHGATVITAEFTGRLNPHRFINPVGSLTLQRGKKSVLLDQEDSLLPALVKQSQVVLVSDDEETAESLGISETQVKSVNPDAIYVSVPAFNEAMGKGTDPSSDALVSAYCGMMTTQISHSGEPMYHVLPLASYGTGILIAISVAAALFATAKGALSPSMEISEVAGAFTLLHGADREMLHKHPMGSVGPIAPYRAFEAEDGNWFFLACANEWFFSRMVQAIEKVELLEDPRLKDAWVFTNQSPEPREALLPVLEPLFRTRPRDYWIELFTNADVPVAPVWTREEFFGSKFVSENDMRISMDHPTLGKVGMIGVPVVLSACPGFVTGPPPQVGQHTKEYRTSLPVVDAVNEQRKCVKEQKQAEDPKANAGLLAGIKVLDLSSYIAGPLGPRHLGMLGADVIKIESPIGDPFRTHKGFPDFNQGKRSVCLNLKDPEARKVFLQMVKTADVVVENFRPGVTKRLGVDYEALRKVNPGIVYLSAPGFGKYEEYAKRPAFDPLLQALSGAMNTQGGGGKAKPIIHTIPLNDVFTAAIGAFGIVTALYHRLKSGVGQHVLGSLCHTSLAVQAQEFTTLEPTITRAQVQAAIAEGSPGDLLPAVSRYTRVVGGAEFPGPCLGQRWYPTKDDKRVFVETFAETQARALIATLGVFSDITVSDVFEYVAESDSRFQCLKQAFLSRPADEWLSACKEKGVPCTEITPCNEQWELDAMEKAGLIIRQPHYDSGKMMPRVGHLTNVQSEKPFVLERAPRFAEHTESILKEFGLSSSQIEELSASGAVQINSTTTAW